MCDTIYRKDAANITVVAELAAIWTALQQIRGYQWIEINSSNNETEAVLTRFLYRTPPIGYEKASRHFKCFIDRHDLMINPDVEASPMVSRILELNPAMRSRAQIASWSQWVRFPGIRHQDTAAYAKVIPSIRIISSET